MGKRGRRLLAPVLTTALALMALIVLPGSAESPVHVSSQFLSHLSESVVLRYWMAHPDQAPDKVRLALNSISAAQKSPSGRHVTSCANSGNKDVYNCDIFGLPQNEESISACPNNTDVVLGGTNDYRGLIDPEGNFTGWHFSLDGGHSITNEGLLPPVTLTKGGGPHSVPSGGDPVDFLPAPCDYTYAASLAFDPANPTGNANGVAAYRSTPQILASCQPFIAGGVTNPECWPVRRVVSETDSTHFIDKPWMFVGIQNGVRYVWVTYTDFSQDPNAPLGFTGAQIKAVRCDDQLVTCTQPIPISTTDADVQFSDVTIGPDGRTYISWSQIIGELEQTSQTFVHKMRVETAPGSGVFGNESVIYAETNALPFGGFLHANDFRVATDPKNDVVMVNGHPRIFVIWDACKVRLAFVCEEPLIKLSYSDDNVTWTAPIILSKGGDNYFATISADRTGTTNNLAAAWYTNRFDIGFHNQNDVVATGINPDTGQPTGEKRLDTSSNETEADPVLGGVFIGDYIEGALYQNRFFVHYNMNYRKVPFLGGFINSPDQEVIPLNQQDNYLTITGIN